MALLKSAAGHFPIRKADPSPRDKLSLEDAGIRDDRFTQMFARQGVNSR